MSYREDQAEMLAEMIAMSESKQPLDDILVEICEDNGIDWNEFTVRGSKENPIVEPKY